MLEQQFKNKMLPAVRKACDVFVNLGDISDFRGEILAMLLLKYLSDTRREPIGQSTEQRTDIGLVVPPESCFDLLFKKQGSGIGHRIDVALSALEEANTCLYGLFQGIKFDSILMGNTAQRDRVLGQLLSAFEAFDFRKSPEQAAQMVAYACESFIEYVAELAGKRGGEFFTPPEVSQLIARLVQPEEGEAVADPCCGSGSLLIACSQWARINSNGMGCRLFGQEINGNTWALAKLNMILHGEVESQLKWGDTLREPKLLDQGDLQKFEVVVSSPPFSLREWGYEQAESDTYKRYWRGVPPRTAGDYAFLSHMIETLHPSKGRMAMVVSLGVLFRGASEQDIRKALIQENLIDAVIALPTKLFPHTGIAVALLVFRKKRNDEEILFVDASSSFEHGKLINTLRDEDLDRIESTYRERRNVEQYARLVSKEEVLKNKCNLSVTRYIHVDEVEEKIDLLEIREERVQLNAKLADLEDKLANLLAGIVDAKD
ncbi:SAM-dependent DNA methyltransferase [Halomonas sp. ATBC28]|uniref:HsdM family class I SAM-dependent methyltransferase n=1 Tax=Halomonadaceae TaxID=28256 RepID=UPI00110EE8A6|nr:class I SAM-dependent DNA methyltransferase [Halomonas sp. ATBC28]TMU20310.1 SAM-dependent DNA methyltransferase [Halomonas sp. ATBC28]